MINGIDVSEFQGNIDWPKVKAAGKQFAIVRAGFGSSITQKDAEFDRNMRGALAAGVDVGAYWFSYATSVEAARGEARLFSEVMRPYRGKAKYPLYFDYEYDSYDYGLRRGVTPTKRLITDMAKAFMDTLENDGWFAGWYANQDYYVNRYIPSELTDYSLWLAAYDMLPPFSCALQQTSATGKVAGITGYADLDTAYVDFPSIIVGAGLNGFSKTQPPTQNLPLTVTGNWVRLRKAPSTEADVLLTLDIGTRLTLLSDTKQGWSRVRYGNTEGYISNLYLSDKSLSAYPQGINNGNYVNFRAAPSLSGRVLRQLMRGQKFSLISKWQNGWLNVSVNGTEGFVYYDPSYITL